MADAEARTYTGKCLCGEVSFAASGLSDIWYCHCQQCQHLTGHCVAAAGVTRDGFSCSGNVLWTAITPETNVGHCALCMSYLFWDQPSRPTVSILIGNLDETNGLEVKGHIFTSEKKNYFEITDGLPQYTQLPPDGTRPQD